MLLAGWRGEAKNLGKWPDRAPALPKLLGNKSRGRMGRDHSSTPRTNPTPATSAAFLVAKPASGWRRFRRKRDATIG